MRGGWAWHKLRQTTCLELRRQVLIRPASKVVIKFLQLMQVGGWGIMGGCRQQGLQYETLR